MKLLKILLTTVVLFCAAICLMIYFGIVWFCSPSHKDYPVRGIDISAHQGRIDWEELRSNRLDFVIIKATEGMDFQDRYFLTNWNSALSNGYRVGAYHFFTFRSSGSNQASNFISRVPRVPGTIAPVIDLEFGGNSRKAPPRAVLRKELHDCMTMLSNAYGVNPILYLTYDAWNTYIKGDYDGTGIWARDLFAAPSMPARRAWLFWQYSNRGRIKGIKGYVDLNVQNGRITSLEPWLVPANPFAL